MYSLASSLRKIFLPILRILGMSTPSEQEPEFPSRGDVIDWEPNLLARYRSLDPKDSHKYRIRMHSLKVTQIRCYKVKEKPEHEYLVAAVYDSDQRRTRYIKIDRYVGNTTPKDTTERSSLHSNDSSQSLPQSPSQSSVQSSLVLSTTFPAYDEVKTTDAWPTGHICTKELDCARSSMLVLDLAIAAKLVHDDSSQYYVLTRQCYWYADVISTVLGMSFPEVVVRDLSVRAENDAEPEYDSKKAGTYLKVPIYSKSLATSNIKKINDRFKAQQSSIYSSVCLLNTGYISAD
jgi:hypothetical protein